MCFPIYDKSALIRVMALCPARTKQLSKTIVIHVGEYG